MPKRILTVASGKGGVGKTTFAVNFALALSRHAPTLLVDLDTATSSVRSTLAARVTKDLYHFHRRGERLVDCVTRLDASFDRRGRFGDFGFVAAPRHYLEELANPDAALRRRLTAEINALPVEYVVLDLRAGIDANVSEFLPFTNSGILVFTPQLPQATAAAGDIVKAIVFRTLRAVLAPASEIWTLPGMAEGRELVQELLSRAEDVYDDSVPNLDAMVGEMAGLFDQGPVVTVVESILADFRVHYVLNQFDGVQESHERAIVPFVRNLTENVSSRLNLTQLGWIVRDERVHRANCAGRPLLLEEEAELAGAAPKRAGAGDPVLAELEAIRSAMLGVDRKARPRVEAKAAAPATEVEALLGEQLDSLRSMFSDRRGDSVRENFSYCVFRALNLMKHPRLPTEFGMSQLASGEQLVRWLMRRLPAVPA